MQKVLAVLLWPPIRIATSLEPAEFSSERDARGLAAKCEHIHPVMSLSLGVTYYYWFGLSFSKRST